MGIMHLPADQRRDRSGSHGAASLCFPGPYSTNFFKPGQRLVPLARHLAEIITRPFQRPGIKLEETFAPRAFAADEAGALQHAQVFRDRLPADLQPVAERAMEQGTPSLSFASNVSRVSSLKAAKTGA